MTKSIGDRMKNNYENRYRIKLSRRTPVIMRLDGNAFHTLTRGCKRPFDSEFQESMVYTARELCKRIQGVKCAYVQSDEISLLFTDFDTLTTDAWFDYNIQKMTSIAASMATAHFSLKWGNIGLFDSRVFNIPKEEVCNYFVWRQKDWIKNSIQMLSRSVYSHSELQNKKLSDLHEMLFDKGINWAVDISDQFKNGVFISKVFDLGWVENSTVIFAHHRKEVEDLLEVLTDK